MLVRVLAVAVLLPAVVLGAAIALGGPSTPPAMASISAPFRKVDFSDLPLPSRAPARDLAANYCGVMHDHYFLRAINRANGVSYPDGR